LGFLAQHRRRFAGNAQVKYSYAKLDPKERGGVVGIRRRAARLKLN
jgi:hypothetical protein